MQLSLDKADILWQAALRLPPPRRAWGLMKGILKKSCRAALRVAHLDSLLSEAQSLAHAVGAAPEHRQQPVGVLLRHALHPLQAGLQPAPSLRGYFSQNPKTLLLL